MISQKVRSGSGQPGLGEGDTRQSSGASPGVRAEMPAGALLLQWFLFSVINGSFCWRGEKKVGGQKTNILSKINPDGKISVCPIEFTRAFFTFCLA